MTRGAVLERMGAEVGDPTALHVEEVVLDDPGPGEVRVAVAFASLCHSDLSVVTGDRPRPTPMLLGHEASGIVTDVGDGVRDVVPGARVVFTYVGPCGSCRPCRDGRPALCRRANAANAAGELRGGGTRIHRAADGSPIHHHLGVSALAESAVVDAASIIPVPEGVPLREAALFGCAVLTGAGSVLNSSAPVAGRTAVVFGCGGVGLAAVMGLRALGAGRIIAVDRGRAQLALAESLGADETFVSNGDADIVSSIVDSTDGGVDLAFDASGALPAIEQAYAATAPGGQVTLLGLPHPGRRLEISPAALVANDLTVRGSYMGTSVPRRDVVRLMAMFQNGRLPVDRLVHSVIGLDDVASGMVDLAGGVPGRIVVELG